MALCRQHFVPRPQMAHPVPPLETRILYRREIAIQCVSLPVVAQGHNEFESVMSYGPYTLLVFVGM